MADTSVHLAVSWKKDNIDLARAGERVYQDSNNTLVLNNITFEDSGECSVSVIFRLLVRIISFQFRLKTCSITQYLFIDFSEEMFST